MVSVHCRQLALQAWHRPFACVLTELVPVLCPWTADDDDEVDPTERERAVRDFLKERNPLIIRLRHLVRLVLDRVFESPNAISRGKLPQYVPSLYCALALFGPSDVARVAGCASCSMRGGYTDFELSTATSMVKSLTGNVSIVMPHHPRCTFAIIRARDQLLLGSLRAQRQRYPPTLRGMPTLMLRRLLRPLPPRASRPARLDVAVPTERSPEMIRAIRYADHPKLCVRGIEILIMLTRVRAPDYATGSAWRRYRAGSRAGGVGQTWIPQEGPDLPCGLQKHEIVS